LSLESSSVARKDVPFAACGALSAVNRCVVAPRAECRLVLSPRLDEQGERSRGDYQGEPSVLMSKVNCRKKPQNVPFDAPESCSSDLLKREKLLRRPCRMSRASSVPLAILVVLGCGSARPIIVYYECPSGELLCSYVRKYDCIRKDTFQKDAL
jgi:hypothetical protein